MKRRDNAPVRHTCPMIDEMISAIESVDWDETYWTKKDLIEIMERIRTANDTLRSWGNNLYEDLSNLEKTSQSEYVNLENINNDLLSEIEKLKLEISNLENECKVCKK